MGNKLKRCAQNIETSCQNITLKYKLHAETLWRLCSKCKIYKI